MGSANSSKSSQQSQTSFDPQLKQTFLNNYSDAKNLVAQNPGGSTYSGPMSADFSGTALPQAQQGFSTLAGYSPDKLSSVDLSAYMNPYTQDVVNSTMGDLARQYGIDSTNANAQATAAHAFGGSRSAVLSGLVNDNYQRDLNSTVAGLRQQGFSNAQQAAGQDIANGIAGAGIRQQADTSLAGVGQAQQQQQQSALDKAYQEWLRVQNNPLLLQQLLNQSTGLLPNGTVGTSSGSGSSFGFSVGPQSVSVGL